MKTVTPTKIWFAKHFVCDENLITIYFMFVLSSIQYSYLKSEFSYNAEPTYSS